MRLLKIINQLTRSITRRAKWLLKNSDGSNPNSLDVQMLAVKKVEYARLARICAESFLHFHPNARIKILCDSITFKELHRETQLIRLFRPGSLHLEVNPIDKSWQEIKLNIILNLSGSSDFFMDCDLRWNGAIREFKKGTITYFVNENRPVLSNQFQEQLPKNFKTYKHSTMRNTSFFSWNGLTCKESQKAQIQDLFQSIQFEHLSSHSKNQPEILRLSEQICLSLIPEICHVPVSFLKQKDQQFDGSICESSYFGSAGGRFAPWGNTNRKSIFRSRVT